MTIISLDSGPLSLVTQRSGAAQADACKRWLAGQLARGTRVVVPEIVEYELRRELLRATKAASLRRLDAFIAAEVDRFIPLSRQAILRAAELWADCRQKGLPTADPKELDIDVIQVAQLLTAGLDPSDLTVATANVGHLSRSCKRRIGTGSDESRGGGFPRRGAADRRAALGAAVRARPQVVSTRRTPATPGRVEPTPSSISIAKPETRQHRRREGNRGVREERPKRERAVGKRPGSERKWLRTRQGRTRSTITSTPHQPGVASTRG